MCVNFVIETLAVRVPVFMLHIRSVYLTVREPVFVLHKILHAGLKCSLGLCLSTQTTAATFLAARTFFPAKQAPTGQNRLNTGKIAEKALYLAETGS